MAFGINDEEVSTGFGANDKVVGGFGTNDVVVSKPAQAKPTPQQIERMAAKPEVDLTKPAMAAPRQRATELQKVQAAAIEERNKPKIDYKELYTNPEMFKIVQDYTKLSTGKEYKEGQDKEQYVAGFMSDLRSNDWNTLSNILALNKLSNASVTRPDGTVMSDKEKLALGQRLFEQVKSFTEEGGQPGSGPMIDIAKSVLTDPLNYFGPLVSGIGRKVMLGAAAKGVKTAATPAVVTGATVGVESAIGVGGNVVEQKKKQQVAKGLGEQPAELDVEQMAVAALFSSVGGFVEAKGTLAVPAGKTGAEELTY